MAAIPDAVLFVCTFNRVRSPMAAALLRAGWGRRIHVDSCGVGAAEAVDPFVSAVLAERGLDAGGHRPKPFEALWDGSFDLIVALSPEAHAAALAFARHLSAEVVHWPTDDPTEETGDRETRLAAYRRVRDELERRLIVRFGAVAAGASPG